VATPGLYGRLCPSVYDLVLEWSASDIRERLLSSVAGFCHLRLTPFYDGRFLLSATHSLF